MKKLLALLLSIAMLLSMSGCTQETNKTETKKEKTTVTLWTGGSDNVKNAWGMLATEFNTKSKYKDLYELKIEHIASGTGATSLLDRVLAAYKAKEKNAGYDIIEVSSAEYKTYIKEGGEDIFLNLDKSKLPNYKNLATTVKEGEKHLVPYRGTTVVLAYDSNKVKNPPKTAEELYQWIKANPGKFTYCTPDSGGSGTSFVITSVYNQLDKEALLSSDAKWKDQWNKGFDLLKELHPYMYKSSGKVIYPHKNQGSLDLLSNGQIEMTTQWVDMVLTQQKQGTLPESIKMTQIKPGFTGELATIAIPSLSSNTEGAHAVLDFVMSSEAQTILLDGMAAFPVIDLKDVKSTNASKLADFKLEDFRTQNIGSLTKELNKRWNEEIAILE